MLGRPLIGICSRPDDESPGRLYINASYAHAVQEAGGIPIALPCGFEAASIAPAIVSRIDGLLLTGGGDVSEEGFGGNNYDEGCVARISLMSADRDVFEYAAVRAAWKTNKPCLGICRGLQVMNVSFGGTLLRDIRERHPTTTVTTGSRGPGTCHAQRARGPPAGSRRSSGLEFEVNSMHHQAIARPLRRVASWPGRQTACRRPSSSPAGASWACSGTPRR